MRPITLSILTIFVFAAIFCTYALGHQISLQVPSLSNYDKLIREKRQLETLDNEEYPSANQEDASEDSSFWDRIVKVALKLFSRFVEWLNAS